MADKFLLQEDVFAEVSDSGMLVISKRYDGPLGQDRFQEIQLNTTGAQALLNFLTNGVPGTYEPSGQEDFPACRICGEFLHLFTDGKYRCCNETCEMDGEVQR